MALTQKTYRVTTGLLLHLIVMSATQPTPLPGMFSSWYIPPNPTFATTTGFNFKTAAKITPCSMQHVSFYLKQNKE